MLPKISSQPCCCKRFFNSIRRSLMAEHFAHFWRIVVLLAVLDGRRNLSAMTEATGRRANCGDTHSIGTGEERGHH